MEQKDDQVLASFAGVKRLFDEFVLDAIRGKAAADSVLQNQNQRQHQNQNLSKECYAPEQFPFMLLPREIRGMVYGLLLPFNKNITVQCHKTYLVYSQYYTPISMDIFKVSHLVRDEAYATLFRNNRIVIEYHIKSHVMQMRKTLMTLGYHNVRRIYLQHYTSIREADQQYFDNERKYYALTSMVVSCPNLHQIDINPYGACWLLCSMAFTIQDLLRDQLRCIASKDFLEDIPLSYPNIRIRASIAGVPFLPTGKENVRLLEALETSLGELKRLMKAFEMTSIDIHGEFIEYKLAKRLVFE